jgi:hypothetical protein
MATEATRATDLHTALRGTREAARALAVADLRHPPDRIAVTMSLVGSRTHLVPGEGERHRTEDYWLLQYCGDRAEKRTLLLEAGIRHRLCILKV